MIFIVVDLNLAPGLAKKYRHYSGQGMHKGLGHLTKRRQPGFNTTSCPNTPTEWVLDEDGNPTDEVAEAPKAIIFSLQEGLQEITDELIEELARAELEEQGIGLPPGGGVTGKFTWAYKTLAEIKAMFANDPVFWGQQQ